MLADGCAEFVEFGVFFVEVSFYVYVFGFRFALTHPLVSLSQE